MADELDVLLEKVADPGLRAELRTAVDKVRAKRKFGLVFESHLPERVRLPEYPMRRGTKVVRRGKPITALSAVRNRLLDRGIVVAPSTGHVAASIPVAVTAGRSINLDAFPCSHRQPNDLVIRSACRASE